MLPRRRDDVPGERGGERAGPDEVRVGLEALRASAPGAVEAAVGEVVLGEVLAVRPRAVRRAVARVVAALAVGGAMERKREREEKVAKR